MKIVSKKNKDEKNIENEEVDTETTKSTETTENAQAVEEAFAESEAQGKTGEEALENENKEAEKKIKRT